MKSDPRRVLLDTNLWVSFFKEPIPAMREILQRDRVVTHSVVIGELLVGSLPHRALMIDYLQRLPKVTEAEPSEALAMIEQRHLWGRGLQWNDMLILAATRIHGAMLWTLDKRLAQAAADLGVAWHG